MKATHNINIGGRWYFSGDELPEPKAEEPVTEVTEVTKETEETEVTETPKPKSRRKKVSE